MALALEQVGDPAAGRDPVTAADHTEVGHFAADVHPRAEAHATRMRIGREQEIAGVREPIGAEQGQILPIWSRNAGA